MALGCVARIQALEDQVAQLLSVVKALSDRTNALTVEVSKCRSASAATTAAGTDHPSLRAEFSPESDVSGSQSGAAGPSVPCGCNSFNASVVTIGDGSSTTELLVGSPETGTVNGVNVVQLANSMLKTTGDQTISGTLTVTGLQIGGFTVSESSTGLAFCSASGCTTLLADGGTVRFGNEMYLGVVGAKALGVSAGGTWGVGTNVAGFGVLDANSPPTMLLVPGAVNVNGGTFGAAALSSLSVSGDAHVTGAAILGSGTVAGQDIDPAHYSIVWGATDVIVPGGATCPAGTAVTDVAVAQQKRCSSLALQHN